MPSTTATSTLVLALEARNNTAAAFAELRGQLREQVTAAEQAARQTAEAARTAQAEQLLALRQNTAQELLELRQRTAAEAQQIRQAAQGGTVAQRQAAQDQILMRRQDAEQQALVMRQSAEQQAAAIRSTTDAQIAASREQLAAVESGARAELEAMRASQAAQAEAVRASAAAQVEATAFRGAHPILGAISAVAGHVPVVGEPIAASAEALAGPFDAIAAGVGRLRGAFGLLLSPLEMVSGPLGHFVGMGLQMTGWLVGYQIIEEMATGLGHLASGIISTNASFEQYNMTLQAIYGSSQAAQAASAWVDQFAEKTPFTREDTRSAALTIASLGDNVAQVLPAVGNLSAIMGVDLPRGAQAFADAQQGRFEMLMMTLRTSKEELVKYGLQLDSSGHVLNNSFVPAFEKFVAARYPNAMALQMQTFNGAMSNVTDAFQMLQRTMGQPLFEVLKGQLAGIFAFLNRPDVEAWAARAGTALGQAASGMIAWVGRLIPYFLQLAPIIGGALSLVGAGLGLLGQAFAAALPYVVGLAEAAATAWRNAQPAIATAIAAIGTVLTNLWAGLQTTVLPLVGAAISGIVSLWQRAQPLIAIAIGAIMAGASALGAFLHDTVFPAIGVALQTVATWWQQHAQAVATVLGVIIGAVVTFVGNLGTDMRAGFDILHGIWLAGWGLLSGVVGMALDLITGNWTQFGKDLSDMSAQLAVAIVRIFEGMLIKTIDLIAGLAGPINTLEHALYGATKPFAEEMFNLAAIVELTWGGMINKVIAGINKLLQPLTDTKSLFFSLFQSLAKVSPAFIGPAAAMSLIARPGGARIGDFDVRTPQEMAKTRAEWVNALSLGFRPDVDLKFNVDPAQAVRDAEAQADQIIANIQGKPNPFTGIVTHYGDKSLTDKTDPHFWDKFMAALRDLKAQGITLPDVKLGDLFKLPNVDLTPPGADLGADLRSQLAAAKAANDAAQRRVAEARANLDLYLLGGPSGHAAVTLAGALAHVRDVIGAERALPKGERPGAAQLALDALNLTRQGYEKVLAQLQKHLDVDIKNHADQQTLIKEENAYLKVLAQEPGVTTDDVKAARQALDAAIGVTRAVPHAAIAPVPRYGALAGQTGYGQTTVSFGGAQVNPWQQMVAALREQIGHLRAQLTKDDQVIALLELGNAGAGQQLGVLRTIAGGISRIPVPPAPAGARSAHSVLKAAGSYALVTR